MLRTNTKKARQNVRDYIFTWAADYMREDYDADFSTDRELCAAIMRAFQKEACYENNIRLHGGRWFDMFRDWSQGLPIGGLFCYWCNRSAHEDVARLLEESPAEAARFTEDQACELLTRLIFREVWEA